MNHPKTEIPGTKNRLRNFPSVSNLPIFSSLLDGTSEAELVELILPRGDFFLDEGIIHNFGSTQIGRIEVAGKIRKEDDDAYIGSIRRTFHISTQGSQVDKYVVNDNLVLKKNFQGQGLGGELTVRQICHYQKLGFSRVLLIANGTVGRFCWSLFGFDYECPDVSLTQHKQKLRELLSKAGLLDADRETDIESIQSSWQTASFPVFIGDAERKVLAPMRFVRDGIRPEIFFGELAMLESSEWRGILSLDRKSDSWAVFEGKAASMGLGGYLNA